jgi:hypothetical protein
MVKEKELSSADKCRRTKLRKKSIDELVNIILRKDDVLDDIYSDMQADQAIMLEQSGIYE